MTDQTIPADKVREIATAMRAAMRRDDDTYLQFLGDMSGYIRDLEKICARARPRPTLADMTDEERASCQWMQADVADHNTRYVIANPDDGDGEAALVSADGRIEWIFPEYVTPRPDLRPLTWPGDKKAAPAPDLPDGWRLADHPDYGRVIVTNTTPDPSGHVYFVGPADDSMGCDRFFCDPARLTYLDQGADQ